MNFPQNWKFGSALSKLCNFGGWGLGFNPSRYDTVYFQIIDNVLFITFQQNLLLVSYNSRREVDTK
jgi:hypothetical protein